MALFRRQLSLLLPEPERSVVDSVRAWLDPRQHALIPAHVTLCRENELTAWADVCSALASVAEFEITLSFGSPKQLPDGCVLLPVLGPTAAYDQARQKILGRGCNTHLPHLTLLHPRHAAGVAVDMEALARQPFPAAVRFTEIAVIEQIEGCAWEVVDRVGAGA